MATIQNRSNPIVDASQILNNLAPLFLGSGKTTTNVQSLDNESIARLQQILSGTGDFTKGAAITDSNAAVNNAVKKILQDNLPAIGSAQSGAGVYNASTTNLLANDLATRAAGEASQVQLNTIGKYADVQNQAAQTLKGAVVNETSKTGPVIENPLTAILKGVGLLAAGSLGSKAIGAGTSAISSLFSGAIGGGAGDNSEAPPNVSLGPNPFKSKTKNYADESSNSDSVAANLITPDFSSIGQSALDAFKPSGITQDFSQSLDNAFNSSSSDSSNFLSSLFGGGGSSGGVSSNSDGNSVGLNFDLGSIFSGCFITTAVCAASGKADNCEELELLRNFRDTYMMPDPYRAQEVETYYLEAPTIVSDINSLPKLQREGIYKEFLEDYIEPAVWAIKTSRYHEAHIIYVNLFNYAKHLVSTLVHGISDGDYSEWDGVTNGD